MKQPLISVIVPIYNVEKYVNRCIQSIINQSYSNLEIILVDDGSVDNSGNLCDSWEKNDFRIKVIHKQNGGLSDARNAGIDISTGKYISFIDGDDEIDVDMILKLYNAITMGSCDISMCRMEKIEKTRRFITRNFVSENDLVLMTGEDALKYLLLDKIDCSACLKLYKKELFDTLRFPYGKTNEDFAVMYKLFNVSEKITYISDILYHYYYRENSITSSEFSYKQFDKVDNCYEMIDYIKKHNKQLLTYAKNYLSRQSLYLILTLMERNIVIQYKKRFNELRNNIKRNCIEIIFSKWLSTKEKGVYMMVAFFPKLYEKNHI